MVFSSLSFLLLFLPIVLWIYYILPGKCQNIVLLFTSLVFYAYGEPHYVFLFIAVIVWTWIFGMAIKHTRQTERAKQILIIGLTGALGVLCLFKYSAFAVDTINKAAGTSLLVPTIIMPIGISFYIFQAISYMVDVFRGEPAESNLVRFGLYLSFFPQLIAGPIVRYGKIAPQLMKRHTTEEDVSVGAIRLTSGICKKILLANTFGQLADHVFGAYKGIQPGTILLWMGALAYTLQLYFDFSGYSDMAVGLGRIFGFRLPENFNYPYTASTAADFWHRWHISLSQWFRDYVYIPLGGSHCGQFRQSLNLLIVWILTGIWHGAGWTFILWGFLWGLALILEKFVIQPEKRSYGIRKLYQVFFLTYMIVFWVVFRSPDYHQALWFIKGLFIPCKAEAPYETAMWLHDSWLYFAAGIVIAAGLPFSIWKRVKNQISTYRTLFSVLSFTGGIALTALGLSFLMSDSYNPFLYFNF